MPKRAVPKRDHDAVTAAFTGMRGRLIRLIRRMVGTHNVEDIVQETFLKAYEAAGRQPIRHPQSFMLTTARNLALNHIARADQKLTEGVGGINELDSYMESAGAMDLDLEARERFVAFCRAVQRLPRDCGRIFVLKRVYGLSQRDIAERLGISENTVEKQVGKGLAMCSEFMRAMGHPVVEGEDVAVPSRRRGGRGGRGA